MPGSKTRRERRKEHKRREREKRVQRGRNLARGGSESKAAARKLRRSLEEFGRRHGM
jgi:hypothetical protein